MHKKQRNVVILGATGSIGDSALKVIKQHHHELKVVGIACHSNYKKLLKIADEFKVKKLCLFDDKAAQHAEDAGLIGATICRGEEGMIELATMEEVDIVLVAVVGVSALKPAIAALENNIIIS